MLVRPSILNTAKHCQLAVVLAEEYPHTTEEAERGTAVDKEACEEILGGAPAADPDARAIAWWVRENIWPWHVQHRLPLIDPDSGKLVTSGTPDIIGRRKKNPAWSGGDLLDPDGRQYFPLTVVDIKKREQYWNGLPHPDVNLQTHAYAMAAAHVRGQDQYQVCLLLFGDGAVQELWSRTYTRADWPPILEEIRKICAQAPVRGGIRPRGHSGPHCTGCYQRRNCPHWLLPVEHIGTELEPIAKAGGLTPETAPRMLLARERLRDLVERLDVMLEDYADRQPIAMGDKEWGPQWQKGKRSASVADLEKAGLTAHIRTGEPYRVYRLRSRRSRGSS